mgnify:CR=1 FL=1
MSEAPERSDAASEPESAPESGFFEQYSARALTAEGAPAAIVALLLGGWLFPDSIVGRFDSPFRPPSRRSAGSSRRSPA